jgi:hypothetical protein
VIKNLLIMCLVAPFAFADATEGARIYRDAGGYGCAVCHGSVAEGAGQAGGNVRGATLSQLNDSLETNAPMQPLSDVLTMSDRENLVAFLGELSQRTLMTAEFDGVQWTASYKQANDSKTTDIILYNRTFELIEISLPALQTASITIEPLATFVWLGSLDNPLQAIRPLSPKVDLE